MEPRIQYAKTSDGVSIAYAVHGEGWPLVCCVEPFSHIVASYAVWREFERDFRLVRYDVRGTGLSDRTAREFSLETSLRDLDAVIEAAGLSKFALFATADAPPIAIAYAAAHPERVSHLVILNPWSEPADYKGAGYGLEHAARDQDWVLYTETQARVFAGLDGTVAEEYARYLRACIDQETFLAYEAAAERRDVSAFLAGIRAPTLLLYRSKFLSVEAQQRIAASIAGARLVLIEAPARLPLAGVASYCREFIIGAEGATPGAKKRGSRGAGTAIILFADIADSTTLTERLGDAAFRERARELDEALRRAIIANGGTAIEGKLLGDGVLATFGAAREAIACAQACHVAGGDAGLALHIGIHAGDVLREEGNVFGGAVNIASPVAGEAAAGETLVSQTVRDLGRTSADVSFEDRGERELKGVSDAVRLYEVRWRD